MRVFFALYSLEDHDGFKKRMNNYLAIADGGQPVEWFHDIFKRDGTPYREDEINLIKN